MFGLARELIMAASRTISEQLAEYVLSMAFEDLPTEVVDKTRLCILDNIGCMLAGSRDGVGVMVTEHVLHYGPPGPCTIFGRSESLGLEPAALANGTLAHVLELDDGHRPSGNHLAVAVVPAALAVAQATGASGSELLLAVALGYDVMGRVGEAVCLPRRGQLFHGNGTTGVFGSAAAAGKLLGLNTAQLANALAIAGDGASGLREFPARGGMQCKPLHVGRAVQTGITAALLAARGFTGPATILEGRYGFCNAMTPEPRPELICVELGERFAVLESGFKVHACGGGANATTTDAAVWLRKEYNLNAGSIEGIKVALPEWERNDQLGRRRPPATPGDARFSVPYTVAAALHDGELTQRQVSPAGLANSGIARLQELVELVSDSEVEELFAAQKRDQPFHYVPCTVEVECGGRSYRRLERTPLGYDTLQRGLTQEQVAAKFRSVVDGAVSATSADRVVDWVFRLDQNSKVGDFAGLLEYEATAA
jgi:2-methylcitrate dehydratase PrpD